MDQLKDAMLLLELCERKVFPLVFLLSSIPSAVGIETISAAIPAAGHHLSKSHCSELHTANVQFNCAVD